MDQTEINLYNKKVKSEYNYLKYLEQKKQKMFLEETKGYAWDTRHAEYKYYFSNQQTSDEETCDETEDNHEEKVISEEVKALYKKLAAICHPDKCDQKWAHKMFLLVGNAYKNNEYNILDKIHKHWEIHKTFDNYNDTTEWEKEIKAIKREVWYSWYYGDNAIRALLRDIFVDKDVLDKRTKELVRKLEERNAKLDMEKIELTEESQRKQIDYDQILAWSSLNFNRYR